MFYRKITLPAPFHEIELFGLVEPMATDTGKPHLVTSLYMVRPFAEDGRVLLQRRQWFAPPVPLCSGGT